MFFNVELTLVFARHLSKGLYGSLNLKQTTAATTKIKLYGLKLGLRRQKSGCTERGEIQESQNLDSAPVPNVTAS